MDDEKETSRGERKTKERKKALGPVGVVPAGFVFCRLFGST